MKHLAHYILWFVFVWMFMINFNHIWQASNNSAWFIALNKSVLTPPLFASRIIFPILSIFITYKGVHIWHIDTERTLLKALFICEVCLLSIIPTLFFAWHLIWPTMIGLYLLATIGGALTIPLYFLRRDVAMLHSIYLCLILFGCYLQRYIYIYN